MAAGVPAAKCPYAEKTSKKIGNKAGDGPEPIR